MVTRLYFYKKLQTLPTHSEISCFSDPTFCRRRWFSLLVFVSLYRLGSLQAVPIVQEFYLPYPENYVYNSLKTIFPSNTGCGFPTSTPNVSAPIRTYISIAPFQNNTIIYYDHWEDGYEVEITNPSQSTTLVWGDNNPANGIPPGFATDLIPAGRTVVLQNNINPSNLTLVDWDARDRVGVSNPVNITKSHWATGSETLMAGTLLVYPTSDWGYNFRLPLGQDVFTAVESFSYTGFCIMAKESGTVVSMDNDANGTFESSVTLGQGEAHHVNGGVTKGARINATKPIQVYLTTGDICANYESRWFVIPPLTSWGNYFFGPMSGVDKTYIVYNPGTTTIKIFAKTSSSLLPTAVDLAPNAVYEFNGVAASGYQFWSLDGSPFMVMALSDASSDSPANNKNWDWGASLLPQNELTQQVIIGWAPGQDPNFPVTENSSPVWLTVSGSSFVPLLGSVRVCVDYDGDAIGSLTDIYGRQYDVHYNLSPLVSQKIFDPDGDQTNMFAYVCDGSKGLISAVWGEDASIATPASPGLDLGTGVPGVNPFYSYKDATLFTDLNANGYYNIGDVVQFKIGITNEGIVPLTGNYKISDNLPQYVTYVANSTQLVTPSGTSSISDAGATLFPLDEGGQNLSLPLNPGQEAYITFRATVSSQPPGNGCFTNTAIVGQSTVTYNPSISICVVTFPEICTGSVDEDGDGLIDCNDPDCFPAANASGGQFCLGATVSLTASGGISYSWSGPGGFTSTLQNPTRASATYAMSGTYTVTITSGTCTATRTAAVNVANCSPSYSSCSGASCTGANLISGGGFENFSTGSPGFTTDFNYVNCGSAYSGSYSVVQSAANCSSNWAAAPDHTLANGSGNYMVADFANVSPGQNLNGNSVSGELICFQNIAVSAATTYCFSAWLLKLCASCSGNPDVQFMVNGVTVGTISGSTLSTGAWTKAGFSFTTSDFGNPSTITVCISQNAFGSNGYDLALDDIELRAVLSGTTPTATNDVLTVCNSNSQTINVLANDASYVASTLAIASQPPGTAGTAYVSGGNVIFVPVPGFVGTTSFSYSVCGAVSNGCCATGVVTVTVATVTATATGETVCAGTDLHLTASGGNTYAWTGPNGFSSTSAFATIDNATVAAGGTYTVTVSNSAGCTANVTVSAVVNTCATNRDPECNCN